MNTLHYHQYVKSSVFSKFKNKKIGFNVNHQIALRSFKFILNRFFFIKHLQKHPY